MLAVQSREYVPSPYQQAYFDWVSNGSGNAILEAVAGSGKTTTIVHGLKLMRGYVFVGAYNSKMAKELKERVAGRQGVFASTFHGAGLRALKFSFKDCKLEVDDKKVFNILSRYIDIESVSRPEMRNWEPIMGTVCSVVSMAKQRGIGALCKINDWDEWHSMIDHFSLADDLPEAFEDRLEDIISLAALMLEASNATLEIIDFDDMVYLPLQKNLRLLQNDWVLIDEAQDTNPTRRALAKRMLKPSGRLVAVGDPHQAIFGFTGADNDSLELIANEFKCKRLPLTITYRCPKVVVQHAQKWVSHIEAAETAPQGQLITIPYKELFTHVKPGDAILCRYNKYIVNLCFKLIRAGKPARIEGRAIGAGLVALTNKWKVRTLNELANRVVTYMNKEIEKAAKKGKESRADVVKDKCETVLVLIERAQEQGITTIEGLRTMIMDLFDDRVVDNKNMITLCSMHRSKGMEWPRVFLLGRSELQPGSYAKRPWQHQQEINLIYVGVTRAMETLYEVTGVRTEEKQHSFGDEE